MNPCNHDFIEVRKTRQREFSNRVVCAYCAEIREVKYDGTVVVFTEKGMIKRESAAPKEEELPQKTKPNFA